MTLNALLAACLLTAFTVKIVVLQKLSFSPRSNVDIMLSKTKVGDKRMSPMMILAANSILYFPINTRMTTNSARIPFMISLYDILSPTLLILLKLYACIYVTFRCAISLY
jgi:hypothetical protein